jgi:hypothetical protein
MHKISIGEGGRGYDRDAHCSGCGCPLDFGDIAWFNEDAAEYFCCQRCAADRERRGRAVEPIVAEPAADARRFELFGVSIRKQKARMFL